MEGGGTFRGLGIVWFGFHVGILEAGVSFRMFEISHVVVDFKKLIGYLIGLRAERVCLVLISCYDFGKPVFAFDLFD